MEIWIVVGALAAVGLAVGFTAMWQRQGRIEARQRTLEERQAALELELGHGPAHEAATGGGPVDLRKDRTVRGRLRAVEIYVRVTRRRAR